jgi:hypothetical protein
LIDIVMEMAMFRERLERGDSVQPNGPYLRPGDLLKEKRTRDHYQRHVDQVSDKAHYYYLKSRHLRKKEAKASAKYWALLKELVNLQVQAQEEKDHALPYGLELGSDSEEELDATQPISSKEVRTKKEVHQVQRHDELQSIVDEWDREEEETTEEDETWMKGCQNVNENVPDELDNYCPGILENENEVLIVE